MTRTVNMHEAKTNLSKLIEAVENGDEIIIARDGKPAARITQLVSEVEQNWSPEVLAWAASEQEPIQEFITRADLDTTADERDLFPDY
jgi:prevent-host-death family protein